MKKLLLILLVFSSFVFAEDRSHKKQAFNKVLSKYEELHKSFFDNDIDKVKINAKGLLAEIEVIKDEKIAKTLNYTKKKLTEISHSDDIEVNKEALNIVSQGLLVVLEKYELNKNYARYYCSMVKKYWIQNISKSEKVMNPYASSSMPNCGEKK